MKPLKQVCVALSLGLVVSLWAPLVASAQDDDDSTDSDGANDGLDDLVDGGQDAASDGSDALDDVNDDAAASADEMSDSMSESSDASSAGMGMATKRRLVLPKGQVYIQGFMEINLSKDGFFKPVSIQPDVWYGFNDDLTFGFVHSQRALTGFLSGTTPSGGLCLGSTDTGTAADPKVPACGRGLYSTTGLLARYHVLDSPVILALDGGLVFTDLSPFIFGLKLGVSGEWTKKKLHVLFGLNLGIGITKRDEGNKEALYLPVAVMYDVMPKLTAGIQTGARIPFSETGDTFSIPIGFGARYIVTPKITVDASFSLPVPIGGDTVRGKLNARVLTIGGAYAL